MGESSILNSHRGGVLAAVLELSKPRLSLFVVLTMATGFLLRSNGAIDGMVFAGAIVGTALAAAGSMSLNQAMEGERDSRMIRTRERPVPRGVISAAAAGSMGALMAACGIILLASTVNAATAGLAAVTVGVYTLVYTPLKSRSPLCTLAGAVCGAIPPMMGWTAAGGGNPALQLGAWILAAILFVWQIPHFLALAILYREDYARGGFHVLPVMDTTGTLTTRIIALYSVALIPLTLALTLARLTGLWCGALSAAAGLALAALCLRLSIRRTSTDARRVFLATLAYLAMFLILVVADRVPPVTRIVEAIGQK